MATIHSFPTELIRHTLSLAYPPGEEGSYRGLSRTALVHSSWTGPSQSLLTEKIWFNKKQRKSLARFVETGPVGWHARLVEFDASPEADLRVVLGKARAGGIKGIKLRVVTRDVITGLFKFASLSDVQNFELTIDSKAANFGASASSNWNADLRFTPWPCGLRRLVLSSPVIPAALFSNSADTLTAFDFVWPVGKESQLKGLRGYLANLTTLTVRQPTTLRVFTVPSSLATFVKALPRLSSLTLTKVWPVQLAIVLHGLGEATQKLHTVSVLLWKPTRALTGLKDSDAVKVWDELERRLAHSLKLPAMSELQRWRISLQDVSGVSEEDRRELDDWPGNPSAWNRFQRKMAAAGIELVLGPLDH